ncbi:MAG: DUF1549 domain-containing protein, partial [Verrucomicrobia bacterium]|nr:DUF1549 domain-containing protein [Verrucomicrobiota bacterium]
MSLEVHVDWQGESHLVGRLDAAERSAPVSFEYAAEWLQRPYAFAMDPTSLPLQRGVQHGKSLFGAIQDCGPDRWGRVLIERAVRKKVMAQKPYRGNLTTPLDVSQRDGCDFQWVGKGCLDPGEPALCSLSLTMCLLMHSNLVIGCLSILGMAAGLGVTLAAEPARSQGLSARSNHWAFQPLKPGTPPQPRDAAWARNPIDSFVLHRLEQEPLPPAPESGRATWLRRVTLDLTGLPPEPQALDAFLADVRTDAHERAVDELLRSPHYGERWAQHWLDVVRYADTEGFEFNSERPHAWPYRDYVIQAFNQHVPYDRFIREQIVGDLLGQDAATGFLVAASFLPPGQVGKDEPSKRLARQDALDEIVVNLGSTFLGLSAGCARCHDHKSDPISQRDYFRFQALVAGVEYDDRDLRTPEAEALRKEASELKGRIAGFEMRLAQLVPMAQPGSETVRRPAVHARMNVDRLSPVRARKLRFTVRATNSLEPCIDELEVFNPAGDNIALATSGARVTSSGDTAVADRHELCRIHDGHYGNSYSWRSNEKGRGWVIVEFADEHVVDRVFWGRDREGKLSDRLATDYLIEVAGESGGWQTVADATDRKPYVPGQPAETAFATAGLGATETAEAGRILEERKQLEARLKTREVGSKVFAGKFRKPDRIHFLSRGDPEQPQDEVIPAGLGILGGSELAVDSGDGDRRKALADFIASPSNPLTARVMANRIWQRHF